MRAYAILLAALVIVGCEAPPASTQAQAQTPTAAEPAAAARKPDVVYVPTPPETVAEMLRLGEVKAGDVLYDLGSGDGRIPIAAARQFGVRAVGIDIDPERIAEAKANAKAAGVTKLVSFRNEDLFAADFRDASVVTLYLLPSLNEKLKPKLLAELRPGTRIVSHAFDMGEWEPEATSELPNGDRVFLWRIPERSTPAAR